MPQLCHMLQPCRSHVICHSHGHVTTMSQQCQNQFTAMPKWCHNYITAMSQLFHHCMSCIIALLFEYRLLILRIKEVCCSCQKWMLHHQRFVIEIWKHFSFGDRKTDRYWWISSEYYNTLFSEKHTRFDIEYSTGIEISIGPVDHPWLKFIGYLLSALCSRIVNGAVLYTG